MEVISMKKLTEKQGKCLAFFKSNLSDWIKDDLKKNKYAVISDESIRGIFDTNEAAFDYAVDNLHTGSYIIQRIVDENEIVSFLRTAVVR
jgi:hypothetical protein